MCSFMALPHDPCDVLTLKPASASSKQAAKAVSLASHAASRKKRVVVAWIAAARVATRSSKSRRPRTSVSQRLKSAKARLGRR